jgi:hypothetical protein
MIRTAAVLLSAVSIALAQNVLSRDANGWTVFTPASDSRIVYVSASDGNDATAQTYTSGAAAIGNDPFLPGGQIKPFKTIAAAFKAVRDSSPDWVLLKRGDTLYEAGDIKTGRSSTQPFLFSAYGPSNERPLLKTGAQGAIDVCCKNSRYFAIVGISFYAQTRDPDSPEFVSDSGSTGFNIYTGDGYATRGVLIEDCMFRFYTGNVIQGPGSLSDIVIRRNVIVDNYCANAHSQGLYTDNVSLTLEENVFDHNGWYKQSIAGDNAQTGGQATMFNHNTYFSASHDVTFRNNLFLRASSIGNKWTANNGIASATNIVVENNLYVEGEIGISMGGNVAGPYRFKNIRIADNVMQDIGRGRPTNRTLGWGLEIQEWDSGSVTGNYFLHNASDIVNNVYALNVNGGAGTRHVTIAGNTVFGMKTSGILVNFNDTLSAIVFSGNAVQSQGINAGLMSTTGFNGLSFSGNSYFSARPAGQWFNVAGVNTDLAGWTTRSGETGATGTAVSYPDPGRTVEAYHATLGKAATFSAFIAEARKQSKTNWRTEYTAAEINDWIRTGFGAAASVAPGRQKRPAGAAMVLSRKRPLSLYGVNGRFLGTFIGLDNAKKVLPHGIYLVGPKEGNTVMLLNR